MCNLRCWHFIKILWLEKYTVWENVTLFCRFFCILRYGGPPLLKAVHGFHRSKSGRTLDWMSNRIFTSVAQKLHSWNWLPNFGENFVNLNRFKKFFHRYKEKWNSYNISNHTLNMLLHYHVKRSVVKVVMWSRGLTWRSQVGANPISIPHPTNLALFGHKITLYRFNQGAHTIADGGLKSEQGGESPWPPHFNHWKRKCNIVANYARKVLQNFVKTLSSLNDFRRRVGKY